MKIKKIQNPYNHRIFDLLLIDENKILSIAYLDNLDIYWTFFSEDSNEIEIKDDYDPLYKLFKKL